MAILLDTSSLTKFGDMVSGGGIVAAVTSGDGGSTGYKQATTGYAGVTLAAPAAVDSAEVTSASNGLDASGGTTPITLKLFGKVGAPPTTPTGGVLLGTLGPFTDINAITTKTINSIDKDTEWDHVWVTGTTGVWFVTEAIKFYLAEAAPPDDGPEQINSERYIVKSVCNDPALLQYQLARVPDFDQTVFVETAALASFNFRSDFVHRGDITGYNGAISLGVNLAYKSAATYGSLAGATWQYLPHAAGCNLCERHPQHYERLNTTGVLELEANKYYCFGVFFRAATTQSPYQTTNGLAGLLVEGGIGLNQFLTTIDHGAQLVS